MANVIISTSRENRGLSFQLSVLTNFVIKPNYPGFNFVVKPNCPGFSLIVIIINQKEERRGEREKNQDVPFSRRRKTDCLHEQQHRKSMVQLESPTSGVMPWGNGCQTGSDGIVGETSLLIVLREMHSGGLKMMHAMIMT